MLHADEIDVSERDDHSDDFATASLLSDAADADKRAATKNGNNASYINGVQDGGGPAHGMEW